MVVLSDFLVGAFILGLFIIMLTMYFKNKQRTITCDTEKADYKFTNKLTIIGMVFSAAVFILFIILIATRTI